MPANVPRSVGPWAESADLRPALLQPDQRLPAEPAAHTACARRLLGPAERDDDTPDAQHLEERGGAAHEPRPDSMAAPALPDTEDAELCPTGKRRQRAPEREVWHPIEKSDLDSGELRDKAVAGFLDRRPHLQPSNRGLAGTSPRQSADVQDLLAADDRLESGAAERGRDVGPALGHAADDRHGQQGVTGVQTPGAPGRDHVTRHVDEGLRSLVGLGTEQQPREFSGAAVGRPDLGRRPIEKYV